jgi:hypothetical protein
MGVGRVRAQGGTARIPAKVMQFIADIRQIKTTDSFAVGLRGRIDVDYEQGIAA